MTGGSTHDRVLYHLRQVLGDDELEPWPDMRLYEVGLDSLDEADFAFRLEHEFGLAHLSFDVLGRDATFADLVAAIDEERAHVRGT